MAWRHWGGLALSGCLAAVLIAFGLRHANDGLAVDAAIPVPSSMIARVAMPVQAYRSAAAALAKADPADGDAREMRGEAEFHAQDLDAARADLSGALAHAPGSARAWTVLAEAQLPANPGRAAVLFSQAVMLAPFDFWLMGQRLDDAESLHDKLDADTVRRVNDQTRLLWSEPLLHPQLLQLLSTPNGVQLVTHAFAGDPDDLRAMNRWVSSQLRRTKDGI